MHYSNILHTRISTRANPTSKFRAFEVNSVTTHSQNPKMNPSETPMNHSDGEREAKREGTQKSSFRPAKDDTKPQLQDPILRSDPIETEEAVLRLPPLPDCIKSKSRAE